MIFWEGKSEVKKKVWINGNIGVFICSWREFSREERFGVQKRDKDGMIGSIRFLIGLETWNI